MQKMILNNLKPLIDYFVEGVLILDSDNKVIVNNSFIELFNIKNVKEINILDVLSRYGIDKAFYSSLETEKEFYMNDKKIKTEKILLEAYGEYIYSILVFKGVENEHDSNTLIEELKKSLDVMKDILDNAYQGMVLVDKDGLILKWNYEKLLGIKEKDALGKHVDDVIENTRLHVVVKTGEKEICEIQRIQGHDMLASRIPIIKDGEVIGAVGTVLYRDIEEIRTMAKRLEILEKTVGKYKDEISKMYCARYTFKNIITINDKMHKLMDIAKKAAELNSTILIQGESGTGKEYFAHAIHNASDRRHNPFIQINCAAIPHELLESELFGYEGGAFTGAKKDGKIGKFELANGGTILLDEISTMTYSMQAKLLRVLEEREFERIGGNIRIKSDVRIISCTNENLHTAVREGRFRQDLYYRLNVVGLEIPPLRDRLNDIPVLSEYILKELVDKMGFSYKEVSDSAMIHLKSWNWPGNVRELRNVLERAANISSGKFIYPEHLPENINRRLCIDDKTEIKLLKEKVAEAEINAIMEALKFTNGSRTRAAKRLGIHRTALYKKLEGYGIDIKNI